LVLRAGRVDATTKVEELAFPFGRVGDYFGEEVF
jgi:hypothetical protein